MSDRISLNNYIEFWYSVMLKASPKPGKRLLSKRIAGWSRLTVWTACDYASGCITILALRFPRAMKEQILCGPMDVLKRLTCHPMFLHIYVFRHIALNHTNTCVSLSDELSKQVGPP